MHTILLPSTLIEQAISSTNIVKYVYMYDQHSCRDIDMYLHVYLHAGYTHIRTYACTHADKHGPNH